MLYKGEIQDLQSQIKELQQQIQAQPASMNTARLQQAWPEEDGEDKSSNELSPPKKARKGDKHLTACAVILQAELCLQAKHLMYMGMVWLPKPSSEEKLKDDGVDVLKAALTSLDPFPTTAPTPVPKFHQDDYKAHVTNNTFALLI
jgi:hypothetical protein